MTENENENDDSPEPTTSQRRRRRRRGRRWWLFGFPIAALAGLFAARAFAHGFREGCNNLDELSVEELGERREHVVEMAARFIDATPQQKTRLSALAKELTPQFLGLRKDGKALREDVRKQGLVLAERGSQQWLVAYGKLADILTPEQRAELADHLQHRGHGGWH